MLRRCSFVGNCLPVGCIVFAFSQLWMKVPVVPHPCRRLVFPVFRFTHSNRCVVVCHCRFYLQFSKKLILSLFLYASWPPLYIIRWCVCSDLLPIFKTCVVVFILLSLSVLFFYFGYSLFSDMYFSNIFPVCSFFFVVLTVSFKEEKLFLLMKSNLSIFSFHVLCFWYCF